jgi:hypothetical protein
MEVGANAQLVLIAEAATATTAARASRPVQILIE